MKENFEIRGYFYEEGNHRFRKYLNIILKSEEIEKKPDLMVVMMNPGGSRPLHGDIKNEETEAKPDTTQVQVMKIMKTFGYRYARVLNLSDYREPKSGTFYKKLSVLRQEGIAHSIFDDGRAEDYNAHFVKDVPIIFAWGVNPKLKDLAQMALKKMGAVTPIGWKKENVEYAYYHPLPRNNTKQLKWVEEITDRIKTNPRND